MGQLEELLKTEDGKAEFETYFNSVVAEKGYKTPEEIDGLVKKNGELLNKVAKLNRGQTSTDQMVILEKLAEAGIYSVDDLNPVVGGDKSVDGDRRIKRLEKELEEAQSVYKSERSARLSTVKENSIIRSLKDAKIKESAFDMAYAYFDKLAEVEEVDGRVSVVAKDSAGLGPAIDSFISEWAKSDAAKDYVEKPLNIGAGVTGQKDGESRTTYTREELSDPKVARKIMERKKAGENITIE